MIAQIERCAATLLKHYKFDVTNPDIQNAVQSLLDDPDYQEYPKFHPNDFGGHSWYKLRDLSHWESLLDEAVANLAGALVSYRRHNRPVGDITTPIGSRFTVTTSLAAAIVEFHEAVLNAKALAWES